MSHDTDKNRVSFSSEQKSELIALGIDEGFLREVEETLALPSADVSHATCAYCCRYLEDGLDDMVNPQFSLVEVPPSL